MQATLQLRADISAVIRRVRPRVVITQSPERNLDRIYASHPDHLATRRGDVVRRVPRRPQPVRVPRAVPRSDRAVGGRRGVGARWRQHGTDTRSTSPPAVDRKIAALMSHVSQHTDPQRTETMVREWMANTAKQFGLPDGAAAETFRVVDTR